MDVRQVLKTNAQAAARGVICTGQPSLHQTDMTAATALYEYNQQTPVNQITQTSYFGAK